MNYFSPRNFGVLDLLQPVSSEKLDEARMKCRTTDSTNDFQEYFNHVLSLLDVSKPSNWKGAFSMFLFNNSCFINLNSVVHNQVQTC